jgi:ubiquinone/menaquinone biosynthesis C-methylase UbiE
MDYDTLVEEYARHRGHDEAVLGALTRGGGVGPSCRVLEVGCGTGNYIIALDEATSASCSGVDPSAEMLAVARTRSPRISFVAGTAEALPFPDEEFDFVFAVDVIHHVGDPAAAVAEAFRVLRGGGRVCVATDDEESIRGRLLSRYFPDIVAVETARYPQVVELRLAMAATGFAQIAEERTASPYQVVNSRPYREKAFSSLHLISEEAYRDGLERMERDLEVGPIHAVARQVLVWGAKP